jgi:hypothetical protein
MSHVNFHDLLRHSSATILLHLDVELHVVRKIFDHTSIKTTERFARVMVKPKREALKKPRQGASPSVEDAGVKLLPDLHHRFLQRTRKRPRRAAPLYLWWAVQGSNLRPLPCEGSALPLS